LLSALALYCLTLLGQAAIRDPDPVVFLENEIMYNVSFDVDEDVMSDDFVIPIGQAKVEKSGNHNTIDPRYELD
jgi:pyruvate dehydrogenase E1 component beta subunit